MLHCYVGRLLPELVEDCKRLLPAGFVFQQDSAPAHNARLAQDWLNVNCGGFIEKDQWPPNSLDLNPLDYHVWGAMHARVLPQSSAKAKNDNRTENGFDEDMGRLTAGAYQQSYQKLYQETQSMCKSRWWTH